MSRKSYSQEFKESAVRLMVLEGLSAPEVSQKLGVHEGLLYKWKQQQVKAIPVSGAGLDPQALVSENELLRKQLARSEKIHVKLSSSIFYKNRKSALVIGIVALTWSGVSFRP